MLNEYQNQLNALVVGIYDSVQRVEANMLKNSKLNLSISETNILEVVGRYKNRGCSISDISKALRVTLPTVTVAAQRLVKKGYLEKTRSEEDARVSVIVLTRKAKRADAVHRYFHEQAVRATLNGIESEHDKQVVLKAMQNLYDFLLQHS